MRLLLVEDESQIAQPLKAALEKEGFAVDSVEDGGTGYQQATIYEYDCIILDLNLPEMDGIEVANKLRKEKNNIPILMLTARSSPQEIWQGFESGTDDYLTKPFDYKELLYRVRALIKRNSVNHDDHLEFDGIELFPKSKKVTVKGKEITLNNKEFGILEYLMRNIGNVVSAEDLLEHVWDEEIDQFTQTVRTNIKTLRQKIDPEKKLIMTIRGNGYIIKK